MVTGMAFPTNQQQKPPVSNNLTCFPYVAHISGDFLGGKNMCDGFLIHLQGLDLFGGQVPAHEFVVKVLGQPHVPSDIMRA